MAIDRVIISNVIGGLGNQMFQYACGLALANRVGARLALAVDQFAGYSLHQGFELPRVFHAEARVASAADLRALLGPWRTPLARRLGGRLLSGSHRAGRIWFEPRDGTLLPHLIQATGPAYLQGYWQSERYFDDQADAVRHHLRFRDPSAPATVDWLRRLQHDPSFTPVSVHLRRGDYVNSPKNQRIYAECQPAYYRAAMDRMSALDARVRFIAFSDDMAWAREVLANRGDQVLYVDHNRGADSWNDLLLMSRCRHHIIANSTFSWWGAWLAQTPGQVVFAPRLWFTDASRGADVVPERWQRL